MNLPAEFEANFEAAKKLRHVLGESLGVLLFAAITESAAFVDDLYFSLTPQPLFAISLRFDRHFDCAL